MIRHPLDPDQLRTDIERQDPTWFIKAAKRTKKMVELGTFDEKTSIWSAAKPAFMLLQHNKCAFCERPFTGPHESRIEMDLEHYRPKSAISAWRPPAGARPYPTATGDSSERGYYWLAYQPTNYAATCKICNSDYKGTYFPIAGPRCVDPSNTSALAAEEPYLLYPIGKIDEDPEEIITFTGTIARPAAESGSRHARAALIIDFFGLNTRDQLHIQRAEIIERFGKALIAVADGHADKSDHTYVAQIQNPIIPHASCLRAFNRLWHEDQVAARRLFNACRDMLARRLLDPTSAGLGVGFP